MSVAPEAHLAEVALDQVVGTELDRGSFELEGPAVVAVGAVMMPAAERARDPYRFTTSS